MPTRIFHRLVVAVVGTLAVATSGCVSKNDSQMQAAHDSISADQVPGIKERNAIQWGPAQPREFSDVQGVPLLVIDYTTGVQTNIYVVEGKDPTTGQWHVLYGAKRVFGQWAPASWVPLQLAPTTQPVVSHHRNSD